MTVEWTVIVSPLYDGFARFLCILREAKGTNPDRLSDLEARLTELEKKIS